MRTKQKERGITFSPLMLEAILAGRKTMTRRVCETQPLPHYTDLRVENGVLDYRAYPGQGSARHVICDCPFEVGTRLWVKEKLRTGADTTETGCIVYASDGKILDRDGKSVRWPWKLRTLGAMYCPRWASRITLEITAVKVERLQDISEADKLAEGATPEIPFGTVWRKINTAPGVRWEDNPWCWCVSFKLVEAI